MVEKVDVVVVGMGPGGEAAATELAKAGLSVIGIESRLVGGECPYYGCIPTKMMVRAANTLAEAGRVAGLAGEVKITKDFAPVAKRIRAEATDNWNDQVAVDRFEQAGGRFIRGTATVTGPKTVRVGDVELEAGKAIVLNTGTEPAVPPIPGLAGTPFWTNREAVTVTEAPTSLIVLGGGPIGLEMAQAFARFGTQVQVLEALERLMPLEEPESSQLIADVLASEGIAINTRTIARAVSYESNTFTVSSEDKTFTADHLLVATGRRSDFAGLGLAAVGVDTTQRTLDTDANLQIADGVYAIGDITGKGAFTHMSMYQARIVATHILGKQGSAAEYHAVPRVTFTDPEVGSVGITEQQALEQGIAVGVSISQLPNSSRGWIHKSGNEGLIKLVADTDRGILVGATSVGPAGGEVLSMLTLAIHERTPVNRLREMIYAYPTFHRAIEDALGRLP
ncbi:MAG: NAD(P)/FAD-dependent oxidoreductase [Salinibacterium sp.]|nr:NAD(P)/FAD-dependent oxidoreductase [Salinibacterium sp.]